MKVILEIEVSDEVLSSENLTEDEAAKLFDGVRQELESGLPHGIIVTLRVDTSKSNITW